MILRAENFCNWLKLLPLLYIRNQGFVDFGDYFGRFSILFAGAVYQNVDTAPAKRIKNSAQKNPKIDRSLVTQEVYCF